MIAHEFFELDDIIEELRMVTDTLCALEVATTENGDRYALRIRGRNHGKQLYHPRRGVDFAVPYVEKSYKGLDGEVQHGLHEGQEAGRRCGSMNEIGKTKQRQTLITPKGRETFRLLMIG